MTIQLEILKEIQDICPTCHPREYIHSTFTFADEILDRTEEVLYKCDECDAQLLVDIEYALETR